MSEKWFASQHEDFRFNLWTTVNGCTSKCQGCNRLVTCSALAHLRSDGIGSTYAANQTDKQHGRWNWIKLPTLVDTHPCEPVNLHIWRSYPDSCLFTSGPISDSGCNPVRGLIFLSNHFLSNQLKIELRIWKKSISVSFQHDLIFLSVLFMQG